MYEVPIERRRFNFPHPASASNMLVIRPGLIGIVPPRRAITHKYPPGY
jgi:hypothetical protein